MRRRRGRQYRPPRKASFERDYAADLIDEVVAPIPEIVRLFVLPEIARLTIRLDSSVIRHDQEDSIRSIVASAVEVAEVDDLKAARIARTHANRVSKAQAEHLEGEIIRVTHPNVSRAATARAASELYKELRVDPLGAEPWLAAEMRVAVAENVSLIKTIPKFYFRPLEDDIFNWVRQGLRHEEIARRIEARYISKGIEARPAMARRRAKLIAVDQVGKFHAKLDKLRQGHVGIRSYTWRTAQDERVRGPGGKYPKAHPSHRAREGVEFDWAKPPQESKDDGHPGDPVRCRCYAEPILDEFAAITKAATKTARKNLLRRSIFA